AEDGIRDDLVTGVQTCALPISLLALLLLVVALPAWAAVRPLGADAPAASTVSYDAPSRRYTLSAAGAHTVVYTVDLDDGDLAQRSEERRVGKESRSRGRRCG